MTFSRRVWVWRMEVGMSKKKDIHILKIFLELSQLSVGECMYQRSATPTAELVSQIEMELEWYTAVVVSH
jgi:hypothetical protein